MRLFHLEFGEWSGTPMITPIDWQRCCELVGDGPIGVLSLKLLADGSVDQVRIANGWVATSSGVNTIVGEEVVV